jgi:hypothetical protein
VWLSSRSSLCRTGAIATPLPRTDEVVGRARHDTVSARHPVDGLESLAVQVGVRTVTSAIRVPSLTRSVCAAMNASGVRQSDPVSSAVKIAS